MFGLTDWAPRVAALMFEIISGIGCEPTKPILLVLVSIPAATPVK